MKTRIIPFDKNFLKEIKIAAEKISKGAVAAFPTDTVYGLGADWMDTEAIASIYKIKGRSFDKQLVLMISVKETLNDLVAVISDKTRRVIDRFWPGPLTLVLKAAPAVRAVTKKDTIAVRMPDNELLLGFLGYCARPLATTSANISGDSSSTKADRIKEIFSDKIDFIFDGGETRYKLESTVLDMSAEPAVVLREGVIKREELLEFL